MLARVMAGLTPCGDWPGSAAAAFAIAGRPGSGFPGGPQPGRRGQDLPGDKDLEILEGLAGR